MVWTSTSVKVKHITRGLSPVSNVADREIAPLVTSGKLSASTNENVLDTADVAIVCVPTPLDASGGPDLRFVESAGETIAAHLRSNMLVILQSTCGPGTTSQILAPTLERGSGLRAGEDFDVAFAPERIDPGNQRFTVKNTPKLVGGLTPESTRLACLLYEPCIDEVVPVSSPEVAELAKLVENTFRFINISFVNEMALLCDRLGVNVWEVIEAAKTKPFAFMAHYPSPGVGGHCIPVVPQYLDAAAQDVGLTSELIPAAYRVNEAMPKLVVDKSNAPSIDRCSARACCWSGSRTSRTSPTCASRPRCASCRKRRGAAPRSRITIRTCRSWSPTMARTPRLGSKNTISRRWTWWCCSRRTPRSTTTTSCVSRGWWWTRTTACGPREAPNVVNVWTPTAPTAVLSS